MVVDDRTYLLVSVLSASVLVIEESASRLRVPEHEI